jgi:hypothetical protein
MTNTNRERGSAMLVTLILVSSLLAGAALLSSLQISSTRSTSVVRSRMAAMYCAEAGLNAAYSAAAKNYSLWNTALCSPSCAAPAQPTWLGSGVFSHDLDGDGVDDFSITLRDDDDEVAPTTNDPTKDINYKVYLVSTCLKYPETPVQVMELVKYAPTAQCYQSQEGGCNSRGNMN